MARLKLMLTHNSRTSTVRRPVDASSMDNLMDGVLDALCEVATELGIPGNQFKVIVEYPEGEDGEEESKPVPAAGGAGGESDE